jgi:hypothetical protein
MSFNEFINQFVLNYIQNRFGMNIPSKVTHFIANKALNNREKTNYEEISFSYLFILCCFYI